MLTSTPSTTSRILSVPQPVRRTAIAKVNVAATTTLPTRHGTFLCHAFTAQHNMEEHLALVFGDVTARSNVATRLHSECLTGDVFGSCKCDCGEQLEAALAFIRAEGRGVLLYLRGHEGRGIGLANKIRAYALQERGRDTVEANIELGLCVDARDYRAAADMLGWLGVASVSLLTNNPSKIAALKAHGVVVQSRIPLCPLPRPENEGYLSTKRSKMGHLLPDLPASCGDASRAAVLL